MPGPWVKKRRGARKSIFRLKGKAPRKGIVRLKGKGPYLADAGKWIERNWDRYISPYVNNALDYMGFPGQGQRDVPLAGRLLWPPISRFIGRRLPDGYGPDAMFHPDRPMSVVRPRVISPGPSRPPRPMSQRSSVQLGTGAANFPVRPASRLYDRRYESTPTRVQIGDEWFSIPEVTWNMDSPVRPSRLDFDDDRPMGGASTSAMAAADPVVRNAARAAAGLPPDSNIPDSRWGRIADRPDLRWQHQDSRVAAAEARENFPEITSTGRWLRKGGKFVGNLFGLGDLGEMAGAGVSKLFGQGAYKSKLRGRKMRKLRSSGMRLRPKRLTGYGKGPYGFGGIGSGARTGPQVPQMNSGGDKLRIKHREYLGDCFSSIGFKNQVIQINPGLLASFPWLNGIAVNFEEYQFNALTFTFHSTSSNALNSANTALGTVVLAAEYNVIAPSFTSKAQAENTMWCCSGKPAQDINLPIECNPKVNPLGTQFVRSGPVAAADLRFNDLCNFQLITQGMQTDGSNIGEIWVSYDCTFRKPVLNNANQVVTSCHGKFTGLASNTMFTTAVPPATGLFSIVSNSAGITFIGGVASQGQIVFPPSQLQQSYVITMHIFNATAPRLATNMAQIGAISGCVFVPGQWQAASVANVQSPAIGILTDSVTASFPFVVPAGNVPATVTFVQQGLANLATDIVYYDIFIASVSNATVFAQ